MKLSILGAGAWGLTLCHLLSAQFDEVSVWGREEDISPSLREHKKALKPLEIQLEDKVEITSDLNTAIENAEIILFVVATAGIRAVSQQLAQSNIKPHQIIVNASKGLELPNLNRMSEIIKEELPNVKVAVLSGPTLAKEVLAGLPTAASIACECEETAEYLQNHLSVDGKFRLYTNNDVIGVELGGSLKNVIAIASGIVSAKELGHNATGAILTRGLAEMVRLSVKLGANPSTLYGLSGIGDLIATCSSPLSRNFQVGYNLGKGKSLDEIINGLGSVAEGVKTAKAMKELAQKLNIETPITNAIYSAVYENTPVDEVVDMLMVRKLIAEDSYRFGTPPNKK